MFSQNHPPIPHNHWQKTWCTLAGFAYFTPWTGEHLACLTWTYMIINEHTMILIAWNDSIYLVNILAPSPSTIVLPSFHASCFAIVAAKLLEDIWQLIQWQIIDPYLSLTTMVRCVGGVKGAFRTTPKWNQRICLACKTTLHNLFCREKGKLDYAWFSFLVTEHLQKHGV